MIRFVWICLLVLNAGFVWSQEKEDSSKKQNLEEKVKSMQRFDGLFRMYQDTSTGSLKLFISKGQVDKDFIYQSFSMGGPPQFRLNQNMIRMTMVFQIERHFDKLDFIQENTRFYFDPSRAISRAENVDVSRAKFYSAKIEFEDSTGYLIDADGLFLSTVMDPVKPNFGGHSEPSRAYNVGNLSKEKCRYLNMRSYPENTDVTVSLTFDDASPKSGAGEHITDPRYVEVKMQHSLLAMPENDYRPRRDDPLVGYFLDQVSDVSSLDYPNYRDQIHRWHLVKKDPDADLSEPVEPITWWIENTTPYEYRELLLEAGRRWNRAFESAGFKNAVVMKQMPDTASWDPADIRYNVIRWVASDLGFAIGPSFVNPRTGQILGSDITIDLGMLKHSLNETASYEEGFQAIPFESKPPSNSGFCSMAEGMKAQYGSAYAMAMAAGADADELQRLTEQYMVEIVLHEMGHTMGLAHNMKASQMLSLEESHDTSITRRIGVTASVMDYTIVNVHSDPSKQGDYYTTIPGPYDHWAIEYGYRQFLPEEEEAGLKAILAKSVDPILDFGNDADISTSHTGIDPRVQVWDMSSDMVEYAVDRFIGINQRMEQLPEKFVNDSSTYQKLVLMYGYLNRGRSAMGRSISRYIGGIYVNRNLPAHTTEQPYTPVPESYQRQAMEVLSTYVFGPDAYVADAQLYPYLQRQRRGWDFGGHGEDPKLQNTVFGLQEEALSFLTHHNTLARINNSSLYGNTYTVNEVLEDLVEACFQADLRGETNVFRRNLQLALVERLMEVYTDPKELYDASARAAALDCLESICKDMKRYGGKDDLTENHRKLLVREIEQLLKK